MTVPYALSVHNFIKNVGADAGFASIIGLAVLILLYFAQMRETSTLRDHLEETLGRVHQLENRVAHLARAQSAQAAGPIGAARPAVAPRPVVPLRSMGSAVATLRTHPANAVNAGVQPRPVPVLAGPPAGFGAPALGSATKLIPTPAVVEPVSAPAPAPVGVPVPVAAPGEAAAVGAAAAGPLGAAQTPAGGATTVVEDTVLIASQAAAAVGGGNGHGPVGPPVIAPPPGALPADPADPGNFDLLPDAGGPAAPPPPRVHIGRGRGASVPRRTAALPRSQAPRQPSIARRLVLALIGLALVAAIVVVLVSVTGGATPKPKLHATTHKKPTTKPHHHTTAVFNPADVTVAVLNGTAVFHLAQDVANKLTGKGYKQGPVTNASLQTQTSTVIGYLPGHETAADEVAAALSLSPSAVQQASQPAIVACAGAPTSTGATSSSSSCPADVIVTVGADLTRAATGTSTE